MLAQDFQTAQHWLVAGSLAHLECEQKEPCVAAVWNQSLRFVLVDELALIEEFIPYAYHLVDCAGSAE
jgi:hypothetical protein